LKSQDNALHRLSGGKMKKQIWKIATALFMVFTLSIQRNLVGNPQTVAAANLYHLAQIGVKTNSIQLSQNWLERFNYYRQAAGLPPVIESSIYSADLAKHVNYMLLNVPTEGLWHGETLGHLGYTAEGAQAAAESNLVWFFGAYATPAMSIDMWMGSIHHRFGMLNPDLITTGFAFGCDNQICGGGLNVIRGLVWDSTPRPNGVFYPGLNQKGVNTDIILTWQFLWEPTVVLKSASLQDSSGHPVAITTTSPQEGDYFNMVSVKPDTLLSPGMTYIASITVQRGESQLNQTWSFTTITFADVPPDYWSGEWIQRLYAAGITGGCGNGNYCPDNEVTRAQMAIFLEKGMHDSSFLPPAVPISFGDTTGHWAQYWIEALNNDGITAGCGSGNYCPENSTTRAEMAVFLLRAKYGAGYTPPAVGASTGFSDVPTNYWAAAWIKQLAAEGITGGCGTNLYCPESPVTRAQMAVFLVRTFNLP